MDYNMLGNRMQNTNRLTSMRINCGNRSFARSRGSSPKQHHHRNNGIFITSILSCKASVTFVVCCLYLMSCCWLQPIVASSSQKAHDFMSVDDLRKIFQVEHHNDVPHYELVKIHSVRHSVSKRSIKSNPYNAKDTLNSKYYRRSSSEADQDRRESTYDGKHEFSPYNTEYGSKSSINSPSSDLGITDVRWMHINGAVYPLTKTLSSLPSSNPSPQDPRSSSKQSSPFLSNSSSSSSFSEDSIEMGNTESVEETEDVDHIHRVNINTHGRKLNLELSPIQHLLSKRSALENTWYADGYPNNVSYTPSPKDTEDIGDVYQDVRNQAAILVYKDKHDGAILMDGTIGDDLVVKPLPAALRSKMQQYKASVSGGISDNIDEDFDYMDVDESSDSLFVSSRQHRRTNENDDYAFLDEDILRDEDDDVKKSVHANYHKNSGDSPERKFKNGNNKYGNNRQSRRQSNGSKSWRRRGKRSTNDMLETEEQDQKISNQDEKLDPSLINSEYHIVYKRKDSNVDHTSDYHFMETDKFPLNELKAKNEKLRRQKRGVAEDEEFDEDYVHKRKKRQAPYLIFPEILCIIDYDGYRLHGKDNIAIKRYVISFWNGIDLRYKLLKGPAVKISIAGIIISRGRDATPYLERNRVGRDAIDSASALTDMGKYLFLERRLPVYDIAVAITKLDMCRRKTRNGECNRGTAGFAYVGGACVVNKRLEKVNSVAIVEDTGGFSGIIVAAHELGHLLGAVHDGSPPPSYLGGPGARKCRWEDGFIMSDLRHTSKGFRWSHCTVKQFRHFLNGETATCMYNSPHETESLPRVLPGKLLTLDAQCRKDRGTSACFKDDRVCSQLFCFDAGSGYCVSYRPAAEGSRCGDSQMCLNGKCVYEHENEVDYDGFGFLRRSGVVNEDNKLLETPSEKRKWWNRKAEKLTSKTQKTKKLNKEIKKTKTTEKSDEKSETTSSTSKPKPTTTKTTTLAPTTTKNPIKTFLIKTPTTIKTITPWSTSTTSTTTMNYFKFFATSSTTTFSILKTSTMSALPWWKRISRKSPTKLLIQKSPSSKSSSTTVSTTTTRKTTTTHRPTTTLRSFARSPTTPLTTSKTTTTRRIHIPKSNTFNKPYNTPKPPLVKKSRTRSQLRSLISGHSRRNRKGDTRSSTSNQDGTTTVNRARDGKEVGNLGGTNQITKDRKNVDGNHGTTEVEQTNSVEGEGSKKCEDRISNIAGSMSCKTFLRSFAYQYCKHKYIKKNCCASHKIYCLKTSRSRTRRGRTLVFRPPNTNVTSSGNNTSTTTSDKVFKRNAKYTNLNIRTKSNGHFSQNHHENKTFINPFVSQRNTTSSLINRIHLSALPSVFQQQQAQLSRFRTNRSRFYRSVQERRR